MYKLLRGQKDCSKSYNFTIFIKISKNLFEQSLIIYKLINNSFKKQSFTNYFTGAFLRVSTKKSQNLATLSILTFSSGE